jgi:hypothetical protein
MIPVLEIVDWYEPYAARLLIDGVRLRLDAVDAVAARHQGQVIAQHINSQRGKDKNHSNPEAPITMCVFPVRTMVVSFVMVAVLNLIHSFPAFSVRSVSLDYPLEFSQNRWLGQVHATRSLASEPRPGPFECMLRPEGVAPVDPAASKEAVTHHVLAKQKNDDCQEDDKQELYNS